MRKMPTSVHMVGLSPDTEWRRRALSAENNHDSTTNTYIPFSTQQPEKDFKLQLDQATHLF